MPPHAATSSDIWTLAAGAYWVNLREGFDGHGKCLSHSTTCHGRLRRRLRQRWRGRCNFLARASGSGGLIFNQIPLQFLKDYSYSLSPQYHLFSILGALVRNSPRCHAHGPVLGPIPVPELLWSDDLTHAGIMASNPRSCHSRGRLRHRQGVEPQSHRCC